MAPIYKISRYMGFPKNKGKIIIPR